MNTIKIEQNFGPISTIPYTFFYDKNYALKSKSRGYTSLETLIENIDNILN